MAREVVPAPRPRRGSPELATRREAKQKFLEALAEFGSVSLAARRAGIDRCTAYHAYDRDPKFAAAMDRARQEGLAKREEFGIETLEAEAIRRAVKGWLEPLVSAGQIVLDPETKKPVSVRRYSDRLLEKLLDAYLPDHYGSRWRSPNATASMEDARGNKFTISIGESKPPGGEPGGKR